MGSHDSASCSHRGDGDIGKLAPELHMIPPSKPKTTDHGDVSARPGGTLEKSRGGSTVLELLLDGVDGFVPAGELDYVWQRGLLEGRLCGCGQPLAKCPMWSRILEGVYGRMVVRAEAEETMRIKAKRLRVRQTWRILRRRGRDLEPYRALLGSLYREIARVSGASVVV